MTSRSGTTLGVSAGNGIIHCALLTLDDHAGPTVVTRIIDVDPTDGLDRAGRVNAGIDLMLGRARRNGAAVESIGVACRTTAQGREIGSRGAGPRRQIHLVGDAESVAAALAESGEIAGHPHAVVVDCGDTGMTMFRLDTATGVISDITRSRVISGSALDAALADQVAAQTGPMGSRVGWASLVGACRTAKESLSQGESTTCQVAGEDRDMSVAMLESAITPMARALTTAIADYLDGVDELSSPVVLVGGLANIPVLQDIVERESISEVICPDSPELLCAVGAALLARSGTASPLRLTFIGGRRHRARLPTVPLALVGSLLAGAMLTVYALGAALTGSSTPTLFTPSGGAASAVGESAVDVETATATSTSSWSSIVVPVSTAAATPQPKAPTPTQVTTVEPAPSLMPTRPSWATTELPTTLPSSQVSTSTITPETSQSGVSPPPASDTQTSSTDPSSGATPPNTPTPTPYPDLLSAAPDAATPSTPTIAPAG